MGALGDDNILYFNYPVFSTVSLCYPLMNHQLHEFLQNNANRQAKVPSEPVKFQTKANVNNLFRWPCDAGLIALNTTQHNIKRNVFGGDDNL